MALIHLMALGDDPVPLEGRLYWDLHPGPRGQNNLAGQTHLGVRLTSGVALRIPAHAPWLARRSLVRRVTRMTYHAPVRTGGAGGAEWDLG